MGLLNWGKPKIEIGKLGANDAAPTTWIEIDNPVINSTNLDTQEGAVQEAEGEGGELVDRRQGANRYTFSFELFVKAGKALPVADVDGKIEGYYAMRLTPEDSSVPGIKFAKSVMRAKDTYTAQDGQRKPYQMFVINETDGTSTIKPYTASSGGGGSEEEEGD